MYYFVSDLIDTVKLADPFKSTIHSLYKIERDTQRQTEREGDREGDREGGRDKGQQEMVLAWHTHREREKERVE